ncbi:hypothetical protein [Azohydromonas lata]|uniref:hypothetical protein n=1 Tax=Azohydromonas lata TaxID=45677 RepID=UPI0012F52286|nr:hypothetical protein [Azohydromonas lata]
MPDVHDTDKALAKQAAADVFDHTRDRPRSFPWDVLGFIAALLLALASAPFVPY